MSVITNIGISRWLWRIIFGARKAPTTLYRSLPKYYLFNETGNILICTSEQKADGFETYARDAFTDVSVFFSAMTKALASKDIQVTSPEDQKEVRRTCSIYNYEAMKDIFAKSGMFVETTKEHGFIQTKYVGETLGKKFVQAALGRSFDEESFSFTRGMFEGMKRQESKPERNGTYTKGGHVFFICELLNGLPTTSVVLVTVEPMSGRSGVRSQQNQFKRSNNEIDILEYGALQEKQYGKCTKPRTWRFRKRSYIFVPPSFISNASNELNTAGLSGYDDFVETLSKQIKEFIAS